MSRTSETATASASFSDLKHNFRFSHQIALFGAHYLLCLLLHMIDILQRLDVLLLYQS